MRKLLLASTAAAAAMTLGFAGTADAFTVTNLADAPTAWTTATTAQPNSIFVPGTWTATPTTIVPPPANSANVFRSPFDNEGVVGDNSAFISNSYFAVGPNNPNNPAIMTFTVDQTSLSLLWGSVDTFNNLTFFLDGNPVPVATVGGTDVSPALFGLGASYVTISGLLFDEIRFNSSVNAFEFSNMATTPVPVPAALPLMLTALAGLGLVARRRSGDSA